MSALCCNRSMLCWCGTLTLHAALVRGVQLTRLADCSALQASGGHVLLGDCEISPDRSSAGAPSSITFSAFTLMRLMEEVGYTDVDLSWKRDGFFVCGGRKPKAELASAEDSHDF